MSTRPTLRPQLVIDAADMSASITSDVTVLGSLTRASYEFAWSGTSPVGTVTFEGSNSYALNADGSVKRQGSWPVLLGSLSISGNTGVGSIDIITGFYAIRCTYTRTSGTGTLISYVNAKVS